MRVGDICSRGVVTIAPGASLREAALAMRDNGVRRLPVIDAGGDLCGMLSAEDVLRAVSHALGGLAHAFRCAGERETASLHRLGD